MFCPLIKCYSISRLSVLLFSNSLGHNPLLSSPQLCYFLFSASWKTWRSYLGKKGTMHPCTHCSGAFPAPLSWGRRVSSAVCLFTTFRAFFCTLLVHVLWTRDAQEQGLQSFTCISSGARSGRGDRTIPPESGQCVSVHSSNNCCAMKLSNNAEIPLLLSLYSCGTGKHFLRHVFVLCLKNTALTRGEWSL